MWPLRTEKHEFCCKTAICRFVECRIGWGKRGKSHHNLTAAQAAIQK